MGHTAEPAGDRADVEGTGAGAGVRSRDDRKVPLAPIRVVLDRGLTNHHRLEGANGQVGSPPEDKGRRDSKGKTRPLPGGTRPRDRAQKGLRGDGGVLLTERRRGDETGEDGCVVRDPTGSHRVCWD